MTADPPGWDEPVAVTGELAAVLAERASALPASWVTWQLSLPAVRRSPQAAPVADWLDDVWKTGGLARDDAGVIDLSWAYREAAP